MPVFESRSPRGSVDRNNALRKFMRYLGMSLPAREHGSKLASLRTSVEAALVAPRAGARIETSIARGDNEATKVAPRAGARIETWSLSALGEIHAEMRGVRSELARLRMLDNTLLAERDPDRDRWLN